MAKITLEFDDSVDDKEEIAAAINGNALLSVIRYISEDLSRYINDRKTKVDFGEKDKSCEELAIKFYNRIQDLMIKLPFDCY